MKINVLTTCLLLSIGLACFGETVNGHLMPSKCREEDPRTHTKKCAMLCESSGLGVVGSDGNYLPFTPAGNKKAIAMLKATSKTGDLQVSVQGTRQGELLAVDSIAWK